MDPDLHSLKIEKYRNKRKMQEKGTGTGNNCSFNKNVSVNWDQPHSILLLSNILFFNDVEVHTCSIYWTAMSHLIYLEARHGVMADASGT